MLLFKRPEQKNMHYKLLHNPYIKVEARVFYSFQKKKKWAEEKLS